MEAVGVTSLFFFQKKSTKVLFGGAFFQHILKSNLQTTAKFDKMFHNYCGWLFLSPDFPENIRDIAKKTNNPQQLWIHMGHWVAPPPVAGEGFAPAVEGTTPGGFKKSPGEGKSLPTLRPQNGRKGTQLRARIYEK